MLLSWSRTWRASSIAPELKVGVDEVVHGVKLFAGIALIACGLACGQVRCDGVLPQPEAGEDVRGHVERVGSVGRDLSIFACGGETARCELGAVAGVDDVVGDAGMVGVGFVERLEDGERLFLPGVGLVCRGSVESSASA